MSTPSPSESLILDAQQGDAAALERLLLWVQPILRAFFIKRIGRRSEVDDLVQNTLVRIHRGLPDLVQPDRFKAFAMKAAVFELQDLYRGRYRGKEQVFDPDMLPQPTEREHNSLRLDLEKALELLTPKARKILELREFGYRYIEIATLLGTTEAAVKMQVKRAFARMRGVLALVAFVMLSGLA